jgi:hypothetical protein
MSAVASHDNPSIMKGLPDVVRVAPRLRSEIANVHGIMAGDHQFGGHPQWDILVEVESRRHS